MSTKIQVRRGTAAQWTSANPTLDPGEIGFETDTGKIKVGSSKNITQTVVTGGTNVVYTTAVAHGLAALDYVNISGITTAQGLPVANPVQITAITSTTFTVAVTTGTTGTYTSLSGTATSPWNSLLYLTDTTDFVGLVLGAQGGTGVANTNKTITLGGNLTTSGASVIGTSTDTVSLNTGGNTSITLPTTGTLSTIAGAEALTNKTSYNGLALTALTTGFTVAGGSVTSKTLQVNNALTLAGTDSTTTTMPSFSTTVGVQDLWYANTADVTFASATTSAYNIFKGTTPGTGVALPSAGVYAFMLDVFIQAAESATAHTMNFSMPYSGTMTDINYNVFHSYNVTGLTINSPTSGALMGNFSVATAVPITASYGTAATYYHQIRISGIVRVTTTGNLNPQVAWTFPPTSAPILKKGSHMRITPLSTTSTAISFGTWS